ncbi:hypothetical protein Hamer_G024970, partial [Homarus americanus]
CDLLDQGKKKAQPKVVHVDRLWQYHGTGQYTSEDSEEQSPTIDEDQTGDSERNQNRTDPGNPTMDKEEEHCSLLAELDVGSRSEDVTEVAVPREDSEDIPIDLTLVVGQYSPTPCTDEVFDQYTGVTVDVVAKGEVRALSCQISSQPFLNSSSDRVRLSYCINGEWDQQNVFCTVQGSPNIVFPTTCNPAPPQPTGTSLTLDMTTKPLAQVYECEQGKAWLSRHGYRLTQCVGSTWTPIMDACEDDCGLPRDCSHPTIRALNTTGEFMVVPSGFYKRHAV